MLKNFQTLGSCDNDECNSTKCDIEQTNYTEPHNLQESDSVYIKQEVSIQSVIDSTYFVSTKVIAKISDDFAIEYSDIESCKYYNVDSVKNAEYSEAEPIYDKLKTVLK